MTYDSETDATLDTVHRFNDAYNAHDVDAVMAAHDRRLRVREHRAARRRTVRGPVRGAHGMGGVLRGDSDRALRRRRRDRALVTACVVRWRYTWRRGRRAAPPSAASTCMHVRDGKVAEKLAYVKG